jgi:hypothetical protein
VRSWSLEFVLGPSFGGPIGDLEAAMRSAGFDDSIEGGQGWDGIDYPITVDDLDMRLSSWGAARRRLGDGRWHVGVGAGRTSFGTVIGNRDVPGAPYGSFRIYSEIDMLTIAPMAWYQPAPAARLGAGLAISRVDTSLVAGYSTNSLESSSWEPGLVVEAAVTTPTASRFYFVALLQYRWLPSGTVGPWEETAMTGEVVVFPEATVTLSHGFVAVGLGIRF